MKDEPEKETPGEIETSADSGIIDYVENKQSFLDLLELKRKATATSNDPIETCDDRRSIHLSPLHPRETTHDPSTPDMPYMSGFLSGWGVRFWSGSVGSLDSQHRDDRFLLGGRPSRPDEDKIKDWYEDVNYRCAAYVEFQMRNFQKPQDFKITAKVRSMNTPRTFAQLFVGRNLFKNEEISGVSVPFELSGTVVNVRGDASIPIIVRLAGKDSTSPAFMFENITISMF